MSILSAINEAKAAAAHAKPFMRLMDSLAALESEIRGASQIQHDADAAAVKKSQLEEAIEKLKDEHGSLSKSVQSVKDAIARQKAEADAAISEQEKTSTAELEASHAAIKADHEKAVAAHKATIAALKIELDALKEQKAQAQKQIDDLKASFQKAHAALTV